MGNGGLRSSSDPIAPPALRSSSEIGCSRVARTLNRRALNRNRSLAKDFEATIGVRNTVAADDVWVTRCVCNGVVLAHEG
jgi:hypothetical protein